MITSNDHISSNHNQEAYTEPKKKREKKAQNTKMMTMRKKETLDSYLKWP